MNSKTKIHSYVEDLKKIAHANGCQNLNEHPLKHLGECREKFSYIEALAWELAQLVEEIINNIKSDDLTLEKILDMNQLFLKITRKSIHTVNLTKLNKYIHTLSQFEN